MAKIDIDTTQTPPAESSFEPLPSGWYEMTLDKSELKPTKPGQKGNPGLRLACEYTVTGGQFAGRKIFTGFNLANDNEEAVTISKGQLSSLIRACGKMGVTDSEELHGIPFLGHVKLKPAKGEYEAGNDVNGYKPIEGAVAPTRADGIVAGAAKKAPWGSQK